MIERDGKYFICLHCNRLVERATYAQHQCPSLGQWRESLRDLPPATYCPCGRCESYRRGKFLRG